MSVVVWKFAIEEGEGSYTIDAPAGAKWVGITVQDDKPYLYAEIPQSGSSFTWPYKFHERDTGQVLDLPSTKVEYIGYYEIMWLGTRNVRHVWLEK